MGIGRSGMGIVAAGGCMHQHDRAIRLRHHLNAARIMEQPANVIDEMRTRSQRGHVFTDRLLHARGREERSEEHTSELQSLMRISYAVFCLKKKKSHDTTQLKPTDLPPDHLILT